MRGCAARCLAGNSAASTRRATHGERIGTIMCSHNGSAPLRQPRHQPDQRRKQHGEPFRPATHQVRHPARTVLYPVADAQPVQGAVELSVLCRVRLPVKPSRGRCTHAQRCERRDLADVPALMRSRRGGAGSSPGAGCLHERWFRSTGRCASPCGPLRWQDGSASPVPPPRPPPVRPPGPGRVAPAQLAGRPGRVARPGRLRSPAGSWCMRTQTGARRGPRRGR